MGLISYAIFSVLLLVSLLHLGWAFGMAWPAKHRGELAAMVVGSPSGTPMPSKVLTAAVAIAIASLGVVALWGAGVVGLFVPEGLKVWAMASVAAVFALRGGATYLPFGPLQAGVEPFRTLDRHYFAPLCLLLSSGYFAIYLSL